MDIGGPFTCSDGFIRDAQDRVRIFRGANVSGRAKLPPFTPVTDVSQLDVLTQWGFNAIRLLVSWEALEPERGTLDVDYIERCRELIEEAGRRGLHVIVDFHQDLFARCLGGDGAPQWAVTVPGRPASGRTWFLSYFTSRAVRRSQVAFWADRDGIRSAFLTTVRRVMEEVRVCRNVVGYDLWNEPMSSVRQVLQGRFEREALAGFYRAGIDLRDEVDPARLLFLEPTPLSAFGLPTRLPRLAGDRLVFAPHLYDGPAILTHRYARRLSTFPASLRQVLRDASALSLPILLGEFGVLNGVRGAERMMMDQCALLDRHFVSWTVWHYNPGPEDWNDEDASIVSPRGEDREWTSALIRPYPRAIAGTPLRWESRPARPWRFEYRPDGAAHTEIVVPARWRGDGVVVEVRGAAHRWRGPDLLIVEAAREDTVTVELSR